jgi:hypothetical protein
MEWPISPRVSKRSLIFIAAPLASFGMPPGRHGHAVATIPSSVLPNAAFARPPCRFL